MLARNGEGVAHRGNDADALKIDQNGSPVDPIATPESKSRKARAVVIVVTPAGRKWRASLDGKILCLSASPLIASARILIGKGFDPNAIIEMRHDQAATWALRGRLGAVAATRMEGEAAPEVPVEPARNGPPIRFERRTGALLAGAAP